MGDECSAICARLSHADDTTAADVNAGRSHFLQRVEPVALLSGGDDFAVKSGVGIEIVVVVIKPRVLELLGLAFLEHAERSAGFQTERFDLPHHLRDFFQIALLRSAPGRTHAESRSAMLLCRACSLNDCIHRHQRLVFDAGVITGRLRTVAAVFGTTSGLDGQQGGKLHLIRRKVLPVNLLGSINQIGERIGQQRFDSGNGPGRRLDGGSTREDGLRSVGHDDIDSKLELDQQMVRELRIRVKFSLSYF